MSRAKEIKDLKVSIWHLEQLVQIAEMQVATTQKTLARLQQELAVLEDGTQPKARVVADIPPPGG